MSAVAGFSHAQLVVADVARSAAWYRDVLGLEQFVSGTIASGPYAGLRHPSAGFVIGLQTATSEQLGSRGSTIDHLSFAMPDRAALDELHDRLVRRNIDIGPIFEEATSYNARVPDPDGLVIEFTAPKR